MKKRKTFRRWFDKFSTRITKATGSPLAFLLALLIILLWIFSGPVFQFSDTWQLVINTTTTIVTFLMVFIIQQSQNKDTMALQLKLNELLAATKGASNRLIDIEDLTEEELLTLKKFYVHLADLAKKESDISKTHTLDEATVSHSRKLKIKN